VPGVIVYAIEALPGGALGDTASCDFTLPIDGSYHFAGLPDGDYFLAIHPLDGSSEIGYIQPGNINQLIYNKAQFLVVPEYWDAEESGTDDPAERTPILVTGGMTSVADILTNIDDVGPTIVNASPAEGAMGVAAGTAVLFQFSEAVDAGTFAGNFNFRPVGGGDFVQGNAVLIHDDRTLMYVPADNLAFDTGYEVEVACHRKRFGYHQRGWFRIAGKPCGSHSGGDPRSSYRMVGRPPADHCSRRTARRTHGSCRDGPPGFGQRHRAVHPVGARRRGPRPRNRHGRFAGLAPSG
jgi:hypothetical protein